MRREAVARLLPHMYAHDAGSGGVLAALLGAMESMHVPTEDLLARVEDLFTPYRSPEAMVPFLLGWLALEHVVGGKTGPGEEPAAVGVATGRLRDVLAVGASVVRRRGTAAGLRDLLGTTLGVPVEVVEPPDRPFHVVVRVPATVTDRVALVRRLVEAEKPAATTFEVAVVSDPG